MQSQHSKDSSINPKSVSQSSISLISLSPIILNFIQTHENTTYAHVANHISELIAANENNQNQPKTVTRRVYDVLNVLSSSGLVIKENKFLRYVPRGLYKNDAKEEEIELRIQAKKEALQKKAQLLQLNYALFARNKFRTKNVPKLVLPPFLMLGFSKNDNGKCQFSLDSRDLEINCKEPNFYSPMNILSLIPFSSAELQYIFQVHPHFSTLFNPGLWIKPVYPIPLLSSVDDNSQTLKDNQNDDFNFSQNSLNSNEDSNLIYSNFK